MKKIFKSKKLKLLVYILLVLSSMLPLDQKTIQLMAQAQEDEIYPMLISDSLFLYSPSISNFDVQEFLETQSGPLKNYYEEVEGELWSASESIQFNAIFYGVNPQWIIILLEAKNNLLTDPNSPIPTDFPDNHPEQNKSSFYYFVKNITAQALSAYDGRRFREADNQIVLSTGEIKDVPTYLNAGTYAVQSVFANILTIKQWERWATGEQPYFVRQYAQWFGNPLKNPDQQSRAVTSLPNGYILPFTIGETWYFTGGPHTYDSSGRRPWSSIDIAQPEIITCPGGAYPAHRWLIAAKGGTVVNSSQALVVIDHGDGWRTYYSHVATADKIGQGSTVNQGNRIGHPSCETEPGGTTTGVHVHFAIWQAGTGFVNISGSSLSGWQIQETTHYNGTMTRNGVSRTASTRRHDGSNDILNSGDNCCGCGTTRQSGTQRSFTSASAIGPPAPLTNLSTQDAEHYQRIRLAENQNKTLIPRAPGSFNKNQVLCDNDLLDVNSMNETDIQNLLNQRNSFFKDYLDPQTGLSASHIIYTEAQNNRINPKLILAKMQAESSSIWYWKDMSQLIDSNRPELGTKADWVLFYGWPDSSPPNPAYKGFYNQVHNAAQSLRAWYDNPGSKGWTVGAPHSVSDGTVTPVNATSAALYIYTPWISSNNLLWQVWWMMWNDTGCSDGSGDCCGCGSQSVQAPACLTPTIALNVAAAPSASTPFPVSASDTALEPAHPAAPQKLTAPADTWQREATVALQWEAPPDAPTGYAIVWNQSPDGEAPLNANLSTAAVEAISPPLESGKWYAHLRPVGENGIAGKTAHAGPFLIDLDPPTQAGRTGDIQWQNTPLPPQFTWQPAKDEHSGVKRYFIYWGKNPAGKNDTFITEATYQPASIADDNATIYFLRVAPVDEAGNRGNWQTVAQWGYDPDAPTATLQINSGSDTARVLSARLNLTAEDDGSGVSAMRFSNNLTTWTNWEPYAPQRNWQLSNIPDGQSLYAQVQDRAGNLSSIYKADIAVALNAPQPSSTSYRLVRSVAGMGGGVKSSNSYRVLGTSGQDVNTESLQSNNYTLHSGFWNPQAGLTTLSADFTASPRTGAIPLTVTFSDASIGSITAWQWSFGDGVTSTLKNPSHIYTQTGSYTVSLTVSGADGNNTATKPAYITVSPSGEGKNKIYLPLILR